MNFGFEKYQLMSVMFLYHRENQISGSFKNVSIKFEI